MRINKAIKVPPGPPLYTGKYEVPSGRAAEVKETGQYPPALETQYKDLIMRIERPALSLQLTSMLHGHITKLMQI